MKKILFIVKQRLLPNYGNSPGTVISSGLLNSATFVSDMLSLKGYDSKVVEVIDNNSIDREVSLFKPDFVIIEALWVVPEKFDILIKLHPTVTWIIRIHSETPFISGEGNAIDWIFKYSKYRNIVISANSERMCDELSNITGKDIVYLPNYYSLPCVEYDYPIKRDTIDIGCFGAIRPFKNHLLQAMAAIKFADDKGLRLRFHINVNRIEGKGEPVLKNIRGLFENRADHELVEHYWSSHAEFIELIKTIDIGMQVSFSETFNIVAADFVSNGKPIVVSKEINWASRISYADPTSFNSMVCALKRVWMLRHIYAQILNEFGLARYNKKSEKIWLNYLANSTDIFDTIVPWENYF